MAMTHVDQMHFMQTKCHREFINLMHNISTFLENSLEMTRIISQRTDQHAMFAYEKYMMHMNDVSNMVRKINEQLTMNTLTKAFRLGNDQILKNFVEMPSEFAGDIMLHDNKADSTNRENMLENIFNGANNLEIHDMLTQRSSSSTTSVLIRRVRFRDNEYPPNDSNDETPKIQQIIPVEDLASFNVDYEFTAAITYIEDYKHLTFHVAQINDPDLLQLSTLRNLERILCVPQTNTVFGISIDDENILRGVLLSDGRAMLIDFGEEICIKGPNCKLFRIPEKYQQVPAKAIKCKLLCVRFTNGHEEHNPRRLANCLQRNEFKEVSLKVVRKLGRFLHVHLHENTKPRKPTHTNPFLCLDGEHDKLAAETLDTSLGLPLQNESRPESYDFEEVENSSLTEIQNLVMQFDTFANMTPSTFTFSVNDVVMITVTHLVSVTSFYANIEDGRHAPNGHPLFWRDDEISIDQKVLLAPQEGDLVLAQYVRDEFWYRGRVLELDKENKMFKIFYVDYGNTENVPLSCLAVCNLSEEAEYFRAYLCHLAGVEDNTDGNEKRYEQAIQALLVMLANQSFNVKILEKHNNELVIRIVDPDFENTTNILVELGFAKSM